MDKRKETSLAAAFRDSLAEEIVGCAGEYAELGLDAVLEEGLLKNLPIVSTAVSLYKIGNGIRDRHGLKKLAVFLDEIQKGIVDHTQRLKYQAAFQTDEAFRNAQLEYLLVLLDRYTGYDKPRMLARLFLAYLDEKITWEELQMYGEVIDRFLLPDCSKLVSEDGFFIFHSNDIPASLLRLVALGLMVEASNNSIFRSDRGVLTAKNRIKLKERIFHRTGFGNKLADILRGQEMGDSDDH